jgi:hypothetical protein
MKVRDLQDQFVQAAHHGLDERQYGQRREYNMTVSFRLPLLQKADRTCGPVQLREHEIVPERVGMASLGEDIVMPPKGGRALVESINIGQDILCLYHANTRADDYGTGCESSACSARDVTILGSATRSDRLGRSGCSPVNRSSLRDCRRITNFSRCGRCRSLDDLLIYAS